MAEVRYLQRGTLETFTANPPTAEQLHWAQPPSNEKINGVIIPLGYTAEEMADPAFQAEVAKITQRFFADFPASHFGLTLYTGKEPDLVMGTLDEEVIEFNGNQLYAVKQHMAAAAGETLDNIHFMVNPQAFEGFHGQNWRDKNFFGYTDGTKTVIAGPYAEGNDWGLKGASILAHEMGHALTVQKVSQHDPVFITDYYTREKLYEGVTLQGHSETALLKQNCLSEYFLEDPKNPGTPLPSASFCITKAIEQTKPEWHDTGLTFYNEETGITHRILSPHDGKALMVSGWQEGKWDHLPATPFQKALFEIGAELYLAHSGRKENPELLQEHQAFKDKKPERHKFTVVKKSTLLAVIIRLCTIGTIQTEMGLSELPLAYNYENNKQFTGKRKGITYRG